VSPLASILNADTAQAFASIVAIVTAAQQAANAQAANNQAAASSASAHPILPHPQHHHSHLQSFGRSYSYPPQSSGGDSPPQRIPTPPARGP
jgi:hypothetical protein